MFGGEMEGYKVGEEVLDVFWLNVGGCIYIVWWEFLCCFKDFMLVFMFSGCFFLKIDELGVCVIDCDGCLFKYFLDYFYGEV